MRWPVFLNENLVLGNPDSNVAICTLWTESKKVVADRKGFAVKGNLYSGNGIRYLVRNLLANPKIRYLVICGNDRTGTGDDLVNLFKGGIDEKGDIRGSNVMLDPNLTPPLIDKLRRNVELIDMRGHEDGLGKRIGSLAQKAPYSDPIMVELGEQEAGDMLVRDVGGFRVEHDSIAGAWLGLVDLVMKFGEDKQSEHGLRQKEVLNIMCVIDGDDDGIAEWLPFKQAQLRQYFETFFGTGSAGKGLSYTYGKRLFEYIVPGSEGKWELEAKTTFDQIQNAIKHLKAAPYTRRAAAFTWYVHADSMSEHPPCLTQITWNIKYGKLYQTAVFRSHDIFGGWPMNAFALRQLQSRMADELNAEPGQLTIISNSAHIYENNFAQARDAIHEHFTGKSMPYADDKLGYFTISIMNGKIVARHFQPDGRESGFVFEGKDSGAMVRKILHENLASRMDHAAYLGKELARAERALKSGQGYVQE